LLAVEADKTLIIDEEETLELAEGLGICVVGLCQPGSSDGSGERGDSGQTP
jgi:hypothetical protein